MGSSKSKPETNDSKDERITKENNDVQQTTTLLKSQTAEPLKMPIQQTFTCDRCGMIFPNDDILFKHKAQYCVGGRDPAYANEKFNTSNAERRIDPSNSTSAAKKIGEIQEWKHQRSLIQSVQDMEDRIRNDSQKTQRLADDLKKRTNGYNEILIEYERLQIQERNLMREMFNLQNQPESQISSSAEISEYQKNQLDVLQQQMNRLDRERRNIQSKLEQLIISNHEPSPMLNYEPYRLLREMREQQDLNERTLAMLGRRFQFFGSPRSALTDVPRLPYIHPTSSRFPHPLDDDLRYVRGNPYDINRLLRYNTIDHRLREHEYYPWYSEYPEPLRHYQNRRIPPSDATDEQIQLTKIENQRLQQELDAMEYKFRKLDDRTRQLELTMSQGANAGAGGSAGFQSKSAETFRNRPNGFDQQNGFSTQSGVNYNHDSNDTSRNPRFTSLPPLDQRNPPARPMDFVSTNLNNQVDLFEIQPYDPVTGFVMFYDFILNFPANVDQCRLIVCLLHPQSGLGVPSHLTPSKCDSFIDETTGERTAAALIATKQPVPRCPPQHALTAVIEVQITTKQAPNEPLRTTSWTKIPLFDYKNRLASGRWKTPLKNLPIRHDDSLALISTLPTFGRAELYYRLVNARDAVSQSNAKLSPNLRNLYFYPSED